MLFTDVIRTKRDGGTLTAAEIDVFVAGLTDGSLPAEQVSALAMAIFLNSMNFEEAAALTMGMAHSGAVLDWSGEDLDGPVVDKHSTGGVGDKVSFLLAPIVAACGAYVPMISGRGLGHTGGTTDKVESIPGYDAMPDFASFRRVVKAAGCAIIGQTADLAPADRRFYAIRDVTGTVESIPLITASILSKKIAAGLGSLVMDIKLGSGAFMETETEARALAASIIRTAGQAGLPTHALLTDMNEVLGTSAGNALEIAESVRYLRNDAREDRLDTVVLALSAEMLVLAGVEDDRVAARAAALEAVTSGRAAEAFGRMVSGMGGPADFIDRAGDYLPAAPVTRDVFGDGFVMSMDTRAIGNAIIELGGGRRRVGDVLDLAVGIDSVAPVGTAVDASRPLAVVHARSDGDADRAEAALAAAIQTGEDVPPARKVVYDILTAGE
jgi:thymidine phosphorylase